MFETLILEKIRASPNCSVLVINYSLELACERLVKDCACALRRVPVRPAPKTQPASEMCRTLRGMVGRSSSAYLYLSSSVQTLRDYPLLTFNDWINTDI